MKTKQKSNKIALHCLCLFVVFLTSCSEISEQNKAGLVTGFFSALIHPVTLLMAVTQPANVVQADAQEERLARSAKYNTGTPFYVGIVAGIVVGLILLELVGAGFIGSIIPGVGNIIMFIIILIVEIASIVDIIKVFNS